MIKRIRSLDNIPKWILFFGMVGSVWFFGMENWFRRTGGGMGLDGKIYNYLDKNTVQKLTNEHLSGKKNRRLFIWSLLNFKLWGELFLNEK